MNIDRYDLIALAIILIFGSLLLFSKSSNADLCNIPRGWEVVMNQYIILKFEAEGIEHKTVNNFEYKKFKDVCGYQWLRREI